MENKNSLPSGSTNKNYTGAGLALGIGVGAAIGAATGEIGVWTGVGIGVGTAIGLLWEIISIKSEMPERFPR